MRFRVSLVLLLCQVVVGSEYDGHKIVRLIPETADQMQALRDMDHAIGVESDYLRSVRAIGREGDLVVRPQDYNKTIDYLSAYRINTTVLHHNLGELDRRGRRAVNTNLNNVNINKNTITTSYLSFNDQMRFLDDVARNVPQFVRQEVVGQSTEGRTIKLLSFGYPSNVPKPVLWIDAGIHAREWIAPSAALYTIWELAYDPKWTSLLQKVDIVVLPNANPDGYEYSRLSDRLWRKTRSRRSQRCSGVDANRNFPYFWGQEGVSHSACSEIYCGPSAMSEPEVLGLVRAVESRKDRMKGYLTLHSYGQDILYPWGYTVNKYPPDVQDLVKMGQRIADGIQSVSGTVYKVANSADGLYAAAGASDDWAKSIGVKYSYTLELSPRNSYYGFELPTNFIENVSKETFTGMMVLAQSIADDVTTTPVMSSRSRNPNQAFHRIRSEGGWG